MNARIASLLLVCSIIAAALWPATARAVDVANGMVFIENPSSHAINVTITSEAGQTETVAVAAYSRAYANRCCYRDDQSYEMTAVYAHRNASIAPARVFPWHCPRPSGHTYGYAHVVLATASGHPALNPIYDGSCYNGR